MTTVNAPVGINGYEFRYMSVNSSKGGGPRELSIKVGITGQRAKSIPYVMNGPMTESELAVAFFKAYREHFDDAIVKSEYQCLVKRKWGNAEIDPSQMTTKLEKATLHAARVAREVFASIVEAQAEPPEERTVWEVVVEVAKVLVLLAAVIAVTLTLAMGFFVVAVLLVAAIGPWSLPIVIALTILLMIGVAAIADSIDKNVEEHHPRGFQPLC